MAKILAIDDDKAILELIRNSLDKDGNTVITYDSTQKVPVDRLNNYDIILLDIMMPGEDGFEFCRRIRSIVDCPVLFITAKNLENDITYGLDIGADDYIIKPFKIAELRSRINAHIRREKRERHSSIVSGNIRFDLAAMEVKVSDMALQLTKSEYRICEFLVRNRGQVFSKEQIYEAVFSMDGESDNSTISTHIKNIRAKFSSVNEQPISTVWGIGYKWE